MRVFQVDLRVPAVSDWIYVPFAFAGGMYLGTLIQAQAHGSATHIYGLGGAAATATVLGLAGADLDAGWRGVAIALVGALLGFVAFSALAGALK